MNRRLLVAVCSAATTVALAGLWSHGFRRANRPGRFSYLNEPVAASDWSPAEFRGEPNRVVPDVTTKPSVLPAAPTDQEIAGSAIFPTQLFPITTAADHRPENIAVGELLRRLQDLPRANAFALLESWLGQNPNSPWAPSLQHELMKYKFERGYFDDALAGWAQIWNKVKTHSDLSSLSLGNEVLTRLLDTNRAFGRSAELRELVAQSEGRPLGGAVEARVLRAKEAVWLLQHTAAENVMCGPIALNAIDDYQHVHYQTPLLSKVTNDYIATGLPLTEVLNYSEQNYKLRMQMSYRADRASAIPTPSVMHLRREHYVALLQASPDGSEVFMQDRTLGFSGWIDRAAADRMSSGYFLTAAGPLPSGWRNVEAEEGRRVFGRDGAHGMTEPALAVTPYTPVVGGSCSQRGMPAYVFHPMPGSIRLEDVPLTYSVPVGPQVIFKINYNDLDSSAPASAPTFSNVGLTWSTDWVAWVEHVPDPLTDASILRMHVSGGGGEVATYATANGYFGPSEFSFSTITRSGTATYTRTFPDGSKEIYDTPDSAGTPTRVFLSKRLDPAGNTISFTYDSNHRLKAVTDAIGQVTTLQYNLASDIYKITSVTDPFMRVAKLGYNAGGQLTSVTDQINLTSTFAYASDGFIQTMTTPYGTTTFAKLAETPGSLRDLEVTDPVGGKERLQYIDGGAPIIPTINPAPASVVVGGQTVPFFAENKRLEFRDCFYWSKKAMQLVTGDPLGDAMLARQYRFYTDRHWLVVPIIEAMKEPFEERVWFDYPGAAANQTSADSGLPAFPGQGSLPEKTLRVLSDGKPQLLQTYYNSLGNITKAIDPLGRTTEFTYGPNGNDLTEVRQTTGGINERQAAATYNSQRLPLTVTDAARQVTTFTYNSRGQVLTAKNAKNETTTFGYDAKGYLTSIDGALSGAADTTKFAYDAMGRTHTVTGPDGYVLTFDYDALDRLTKVTYPDGTSEQYTYNKLDRVGVKDRLNRNTTATYTPLRQLATITDPANRKIAFEWCQCGVLEGLTDPMGRTTHWNYDAQSRLTKKEYPDGSKVSYQYEQTTSRLKDRIDEKGQVTLYSYNVDDTLQSVSYPNAKVATPTVTFAYDTKYRRPLSMVDGIGTTHYAYVPITASPSPSPGAGQLASIDGPWANDTIAYTYDQLGRATGRSINNVAQTLTFDAAGRVTTIANPLGTFSYTYDGATDRLSSAAHNAGVKSLFTYFPNNQDRRLKEIRNVKPDGTTPLSVFDYTYDASGRILTWKQQVDTAAATAASWTLGYDNADQLLSASISQSGSPTKNYSWTYDAAGNRKTEMVDGSTTTFNYNALNELVNNSSTLPNTTYEWNAENRLVATNTGTARTQLYYDGFGRRVRIVEKNNGNVVSDSKYLWCGLSLCEARDSTGGTVRQRYFGQGLQGISGQPVGANLYTFDHLGSIRELVDTAGALKERISYDAWGKPSFSNSTSLNSFAYTHHFWHTPSQLYFAPFRSYSPLQGRWLSRDPIHETGGFNLYSYVRNDPVRQVDPLGLECAGSAATQTTEKSCGQRWLEWARDKGLEKFVTELAGPASDLASFAENMQTEAENEQKREQQAVASAANNEEAIAKEMANSDPVNMVRPVVRAIGPTALEHFLPPLCIPRSQKAPPATATISPVTQTPYGDIMTRDPESGQVTAHNPNPLTWRR
jgi:RHS repeat-associated protein